MLTPSTLQIWLTEQAVPLSIIAVLLIAGFLLLKISSGRRRAALIRERAGHTEDGFVQHLSTFGFDPRIARTTYRYLQNEQNVGYPILLQDELDEDLGLDSAGVKETIQALLTANGRTSMPGMRNEPVLNVEDLVRYIQASPRQREIAA